MKNAMHSPRFSNALRAEIAKRGRGELARAASEHKKKSSDLERFFKRFDVSKNCRKDTILGNSVFSYTGNIFVSVDIERVSHAWFESIASEDESLGAGLFSLMEMVEIDGSSGVIRNCPLPLANFLIFSDDNYLDLLWNVMNSALPNPELPVCDLMEDEKTHHVIANAVHNYYLGGIFEPFQELSTRYLLPSPDGLKDYFLICCELQRISFSIAIMYLHAKTMMTYLKIPSPGLLAYAERVVRPMVGDDVLKPAIRRHCSTITHNVAGSRIMENIVIESLLRLLYPREHLAILQSLNTPKNDSSVPVSDVDANTEKKLDKIKDRLSEAGISYEINDARFCINALGSELDEEDREEIALSKICSALYLSAEGMSIGDALFLVQNADGSAIEIHKELDGVLDFFDLDHKSLHEILSFLNAGDSMVFCSRLQHYSKWMELMPGSQLHSGEKMFLSAFLAIYAPNPPAERRLVAAHLGECEESFIDAALSYEGSSAEKLLLLYEEYQEYAERFVHPVAILSNEPAETPVPDVAKPSKPHKSLVFSKNAFDAIKDAGISIDDMRLALAYGLRLTSGKRAVGGRYFPVQFFRNNCEAILPNGDISVSTKRANIEKFLLAHGVISLYRKKDGQVRLNIKEDGYYVEPSETGRQILDDVLSWLSDFKREVS